MPLTGRAVTSRKFTVDDGSRLDLLHIQREGLFHPGPARIWGWHNEDGDSNTVGFQFDGWAGRENDPVILHLDYSVTGWNEIKSRVQYSVVIAVTACHFGAYRHWFVCPLSLNGKPCERRCRILYLPPGAKYFGCRECHQLTYQCRQRHRESVYEQFLKPEQTLEKLAKFKPPRSRAAFVRRWRRFKRIAQTPGGSLWGKASR